MKNPCPHPSNSIQQFTECCLKCGRNIYESDDEYTKYMTERMVEEHAAKDRSDREKRNEIELLKLQKKNAELEMESLKLDEELDKAKKEAEEARKKLAAMIAESKAKKAAEKKK